MSVEAWSITPEYTVAGTGPYTITHPYVAGAIRAYVQLATGRLQLNPSEFAVSPEASETDGNLTLSPTAAAAHAGLPLIIDRVTPDEQGWLAVQGEREAGLAAQLDRMVQSIQELRARGSGALRVRIELDPFDWDEGTVPVLEGGKVKSGPTVTAIAAAQTRATEAAASAAAAAASAAEALAKENSMLRDRGAWTGGLLYSPSDIFTSNGTSYITQTAHIASSIAADQAAGRIRVFAAKGDAGAGSGDMLKTENLSGLTNVPQARTNLGLQAMAIKANVAFADMLAAAVRTAAEGLVSPTDTELATAAWAAAYAEAVPRRKLLASWDWSTNVSGFNLTGLAGWDDVQVYIANLNETASILRVRVSFDNGSTIQSTGYNGGTMDGVGSSDYTDGLYISRAAATAALNGSVHLEGMATGPRCVMRGTLAAIGGSRVPLGASLAPAGVVNAIRIVGNTITSGSVRVFGLRRAAP